MLQKDLIREIKASKKPVVIGFKYGFVQKQKFTNSEAIKAIKMQYKPDDETGNILRPHKKSVHVIADPAIQGSVDMVIDPLNDIKRKVELFFNSLYAIAGSRILSITTSSGDHYQFHLDENNDCDTYGPADIGNAMLKAKVTGLFVNGGSMIIRQFLPMKIEIINGFGNKMWVPRKRLYGNAFENLNWIAIDADEMRICANTDAKTGEVLEPEEGVTYGFMPLYDEYLKEFPIK